MEELDLYEYWQIIRRRTSLILLCGATALLCAGVILAIMPRTYLGSTNLLFPVQSSGMAGLLSQLGNLPLADLGSLRPGADLKDTYYQIAQSRRIAENVHRRLQLDRLELEIEDLQKAMEISKPKTGGLTIDAHIPTSWLKRGRLPWLEAKSRDTGIRRQTAILAAEIANTYADEMARFQERYAFTSGRRNRIFVEQELARTRRALSRAEDALRRFKQSNPSVVLPDMSGKMYDQLAELRAEQLKTEAALRETEERLRTASLALSGQEETILASTEIAENPVVSELKKQLAILEVRRASLLQDRTERHPDVVDVEQEIEATKSRMRDEIERITARQTRSINPVRQQLVESFIGLQVDSGGLGARSEAMAQVIKSAEKKIAGLASPQLQLVRLTREAKALDAVYTTLLGERAKAQIAEAREPQDFVVLDRAKPEKRHEKPKIKLTLAASLLLGLMAGAMLAFAAEGSTRARKKQAP